MIAFPKIDLWWAVVIWRNAALGFKLFCSNLWIIPIFYPLAFKTKGVLSLPASVHSSVQLSIHKLYFVHLITHQRFELESPNLHQACILGYSELILKIGVIDINFQGHLAISSPRNGIQLCSCIPIQASQGVLHIPTWSCYAMISKQNGKITFYDPFQKHSSPPVSLEGQLLWREFFYTVATATPNFNKMEGNAVCRQIPWDHDEKLLEAWTQVGVGLRF